MHYLSEDIIGQTIIDVCDETSQKSTQYMLGY